MKKTGLVYLLDMFGGWGEEVWCDLVCVKHLQMIGLMVVLIGLMVVMMSLSGMVIMVLVLQEFKDKTM